MRARATGSCAPAKTRPLMQAIKDTGDDPDIKKAHDMAVANKKARTEGWERWLALLKSM